MESDGGFFPRAAVPAVCKDDAADVPEKCGDLSQGAAPPNFALIFLVVRLDEGEREENPNLRGNSATLSEHVVKDGFPLCQARFGPSRQMQSYYGSLPATKRFGRLDATRNFGQIAVR